MIHLTILLVTFYIKAYNVGRLHEELKLRQGNIHVIRIGSLQI